MISWNTPTSTQMMVTKRKICSELPLRYEFYCDSTDPMSFTWACMKNDVISSGKIASFLLSCIDVFSIYFDLMINCYASSGSIQSLLVG